MLGVHVTQANDRTAGKLFSVQENNTKDETTKYQISLLNLT